MKKLVFICCAMLCLFTIKASHFFVSTTGTNTNPGTIMAPWSLSYAMTHPPVVLAGDTVWLRGGVYKGQFNCLLQGAQGANIVIRNYNKERAIIKDTVHVGGSSNTFQLYKNYVTVWGLEFTADSSSAGHYALKVNLGTGVKLINNIVHNGTSVGIGISDMARDVEAYGNLVFDNGIQGDVTQGDIGHGHGMYIQNNPDRNYPRIIKSNFIFNNQKCGLTFFSETNKQCDAVIMDNVVFNQGAMLDTSITPTYTAQTQRFYNMVIGGNTHGVARVTLQNNILYRDANGKNVTLGYANKDTSLIATGNHFINMIGNNYTALNLKPYNGYGPVVIRDWKQGGLTFTDNTIYTPRVGYGIDWDLSTASTQTLIPTYTWDRNHYYRVNRIAGLSIANWKMTYGKDANATISTSAPTTNVIKIVQNQYEPNKLYITVLNWEQLSYVLQNLDAFITNGSTYNVYDIQNIFAGPINTGTYTLGGTVSLNMGLTQVSHVSNSPERNLFCMPRHTCNYMGTFIVEYTGNASVGLKEYGDSQVTIYLNPTDGIINLNFGTLTTDNMAIEVYTTLGHLVLSQFVNGASSTQLNVSSFSKGIYYVKCSSLQLNCMKKIILN